MSSLPMPTIAARIRRPSSIRKKSLLAIFALLGAGVVVGCIAVLSVFEFKSRAGQSQPTPEMELVKRQFQGGGLMGDTPVEPVVSALNSGLPVQADVTPFGDPLLPVDPQAASSGGPLGDVAGVVSTLLGGAVSTPPWNSDVTAVQPLESTADGLVSQIIDGAGATDGLPQMSPIATPVGQWSTPGGLVQDGVSVVDSLLNGGATPPVSIPITPGVPLPIDPSASVTLPPLSTPIGTPLSGEDFVDGLSSQVESLLSDDTALPVSATLPLSSLGPEQLSVSLPLTPSIPAGMSPSVSQPTEGALPSSDSALPGLEDIISEDGNTDVDSAALLSGLSNIVDQISGVDPEAAGDLTDAVVAALPGDVSDSIPNAQDAIDAGSSDALDAVIPSLGDVLGEDIIPAAPIDPSDASGALGNVVNRGKTIINQINEAMGDNIDPALQDVIDNVSGIVESAEGQLTDPMCLVSQVVNGVTDQVLVPCADAEPGAPTAIDHLSPTQYQAPAHSEYSAQPDPSPQQPQSGNLLPGVPSDDTRENPSPSQGSPGGSPSIPEIPTQGDDTNSQASQEPSQSTSPQQSSSSSTSSQTSLESDTVNAGEQLPPPGAVPEASRAPSSPPQEGSESGSGGQTSGGADASAPGSQPAPQSGNVNAGERPPASGTASSPAQEGSNSGSGSGSSSQSSGETGSSNEPSSPSDGGQEQSWSYPASSNGEDTQGGGAPDQVSSPVQESSVPPGSGSSPGTPATPTTPNSSGNAAPENAAPENAAPVDYDCPICPQCMPQSCDGNHGFDADQSPCDGRGFECDECLHGWFCPPRETPAQAAPCGLGWPCYHCSDGWFCVPDEDDSPYFVISSNSNSDTASSPPEYGDSGQNKRQGASERGGSDDGVNNYYSLGCFEDSISRTLLGGVPVDYLSGRMSTSICVNHCIERGYTFAGTENGHECWCGETMRPDAKKLPESSCKTSCHGNQGSVCGGNMAISVFADQDEYLESIRR